MSLKTHLRPFNQMVLSFQNCAFDFPCPHNKRVIYLFFYCLLGMSKKSMHLSLDV